MFHDILNTQNGEFSDENRREFARRAFKVTSNYDISIFNWFNEGTTDIAFKHSIRRSDILRYGENPHQNGVFFGEFDKVFDKLNGKAISYNNLVDIDAAVQLMREFQVGETLLCHYKHTTPVVSPAATASWKPGRPHWLATVHPLSAVFITNTTVDLAAAGDQQTLLRSAYRSCFRSGCYEFAEKERRAAHFVENQKTSIFRNARSEACSMVWWNRIPT